jgi:hypothetical protein
VRRFLLLACCLVLFASTASAGDTVAPRRYAGAGAARASAPVKAVAPAVAQAEGTLRRNREAQPGQPAYALLDAQGRVATYLAPQQGVKLAPYVGRRIRVAGVKSATAAGGQFLRVASVEPTMGVVEPTEEVEAAPVAFEEEIGEPLAEAEGEPYYEGAIGEPDCGIEGPFRGQHFMGHRPLLSGWYGRAEYLYWWTDGMYVPALVTTSPTGTARADAGVIGPPGTTILFGQGGLNNNGISGGRITLGHWFDACQEHAIEGDFWMLGQQSSGYFASSNGDPILARPFFDINNATESSELVAFPNVLRGSVAVDPVTKVYGGGLRKRWRLCGCLECDPCNPCCCDGWGFDVTGGWRYMRLDDSLSIRENLVSLDPAAPGSFVVFDQFRTQNTFNGGEVGTILTGRRGLLSWELLGRLALGNTHSRININGFTDITPPGGATTRSQGGLLAQRTNIGTYERDAFAVVPELGATVGWQLNPTWRITFGYTFIYWSNVVRAGQQIDRSVNTNLLPPEANPFTGNLNPRFVVNDTDFFVQGINIGLDARW